MNILFVLILFLLTFGFLSDLVLDLLNVRHFSSELPGLLVNRYDTIAYKKSQKYLQEISRFGILLSILSFAAVFLMFLSGSFTWLNTMVYNTTDHPIIAALMFFGILGFAADLAGTPFQIYSTFVIEEKYGFNKTTPGTFVLDKMKSWLLGLLIGAPLLALIVWLYGLTGKWFWVLAWAAVTTFSVLFSFLYSTLLVPLFNKQVLLGEGELRSAIEEMGQKAGFQISRIFIIDGSKRSTKANAYFSGFGSRRRIVLYDTLLNDLSQPQVLAVLAHEIGHYKKKHILKSMALSILQTGILLFVFSLVSDNPALARSLNIAQPNFHISVLVFGILYSPVSTLTGLVFNFISRAFEYQADAFAGSMGLKTELSEALIRLTEKNLGNLTPHPAYVFVHYSHPPLLQRLKSLSE